MFQARHIKQIQKVWFLVNPSLAGAGCRERRPDTQLRMLGGRAYTMLNRVPSLLRSVVATVPGMMNERPTPELEKLDACCDGGDGGERGLAQEFPRIRWQSPVCPCMSAGSEIELGFWDFGVLNGCVLLLTLPFGKPIGNPFHHSCCFSGGGFLCKPQANQPQPTPSCVFLRGGTLKKLPLSPSFARRSSRRRWQRRFSRKRRPRKP